MCAIVGDDVGCYFDVTIDIFKVLQIYLFCMLFNPPLSNYLIEKSMSTAN